MIGRRMPRRSETALEVFAAGVFSVMLREYEAALSTRACLPQGRLRVRRSLIGCTSRVTPGRPA
jgi:hypothetical protein